MSKSIQLLPHQLISLETDVLGTSTMCKIEHCTAPEITKMKTPRDEQNKGYHRESSAEKQIDALKAIKLLWLDDTNPKEKRDQAKQAMFRIGTTYARLCGGFFITQEEADQFITIIERFKPGRSNDAHGSD